MMKKILLTLSLLIFVSCAALISQNSLVSFDSTGWAVFDTSNSGLPNNEINCITGDNNDKIWIGTENGLATFDRNNWEVFDTTNSGFYSGPVSCIAVSNAGIKYIGDGMNLWIFDDVNWTSYMLMFVLNQYIGGPTSLAVDDNETVWMGVHMGGLVSFDGSNWIVYDTLGMPPIADIYAVAIDANNAKWMGGGGLLAYDGINWTLYNSLNSVLSGDCVISLAINNGIIWIGTCSDGLISFDGSNWNVYDTSNSDIPSNTITALDIDQNGNIWLGCGYNYGLVYFDGTDWINYTTTNSGLPANSITAITIDENGTKWIGTEYWGLAAFNENGLPFNISENNDRKFEYLHIYPNPSNSTITIELPPQPSKNTSLTISNTNGQLLITQPITKPQTEIDISHLPNGIYIVKVWNDRDVMVQKVIKQ